MQENLFSSLFFILLGLLLVISGIGVLLQGLVPRVAHYFLFFINLCLTVMGHYTGNWPLDRLKETKVKDEVRGFLGIFFLASGLIILKVAWTSIKNLK